MIFGQFQIALPAAEGWFKWVYLFLISLVFVIISFVFYLVRRDSLFISEVFASLNVVGSDMRSEDAGAGKLSVAEKLLNRKSSAHFRTQEKRNPI